MENYQKPTDQEILEQTTHDKEQLISQGVTTVECDPDEADLLGAFKEDALSEEDALEAIHD